MNGDLSPRAQRILEAIVETFVSTGEPVGSRALTRAYPLAVSPATVRHEMVDLEEAGFLLQPHKSAGRVPTDQAFRWFVDRKIDRVRPRLPPREDRERLERWTPRSPANLDAYLRGSSRALSLLTRCPCVVVSPHLDDLVYLHIDFVRVRRGEVLVVLVSASGFVTNRLVRLEDDVDQDHLTRIAHELDRRLNGATLAEVRDRILDDLARDRALFDDLARHLIELSRDVVADETQGEIYVEGTARLLDYPEFHGSGRAHLLLRALEDRSLMVDILDRARTSGGLHVSIGSETGVAGMEDVAVVTSPYRHGPAPLGSIGIIGPTRLDYERVVPVVEYAAQLVSKYLDVT